MQDFVEYAINLPLLTLEEEQALVSEYVATKSKEAARKLVLHHLKIVIPMAYKFKRSRIGVEDMIQEGSIGLINALRNYDPNCNTRFGTFALPHVKNAILEYVVRNDRIVKIAYTKDQRKCLFNINKYKSDTSEPLSKAQIKKVARDINVSVECVEEMDKRLIHHNVDISSLDYEIPSNRFDWEVEQTDFHNKTMKQVSKLIDSLNDRTRDILKSRWLQDDPIMLRELAEKYGVSTSRISEIEKLALQKLRNSIEHV